MVEIKLSFPTIEEATAFLNRQAGDSAGLPPKIEEKPKRTRKAKAPAQAQTQATPAQTAQAQTQTQAQTAPAQTQTQDQTQAAPAINREAVIKEIGQTLGHLQKIGQKPADVIATVAKELGVKFQRVSELGDADLSNYVAAMRAYAAQLSGQTPNATDSVGSLL